MSLGYVIKEGMAGFKRARMASFTSMFSLFIAVLLLGVLARVSFNAYQIGEALKQSIDVEVYIQDLDDRTRLELQGQLKEKELVEQVSFISKDSAAAIFKEEFGTGSSSLADLQFLPASFRVKIDPDATIEEVEKLVDEIEGYRGVDEIEFNRQLMELIRTRFQTITMAGGGIGLLILLTALVLVFNTIRLTIYAKRGLIKAMKLVGATNGFIRRPFLVEGILQGLISGLFATGVMYLLFHYLIPRYLPQIGILEWPFGRWYFLCAGMVLLAIFMGLWGSRWAARKFIKETSIGE